MLGLVTIIAGISTGLFSDLRWWPGKVVGLLPSSYGTGLALFLTAALVGVARPSEAHDGCVSAMPLRSERGAPLLAEEPERELPCRMRADLQDLSVHRLG